MNLKGTIASKKAGFYGTNEFRNLRKLIAGVAPRFNPSISDNLYFILFVADNPGLNIANQLRHDMGFTKWQE